MNLFKMFRKSKQIKKTNKDSTLSPELQEQVSKSVAQFNQKIDSNEKPDIEKMIAENYANTVVDIYMYIAKLCSYGEHIDKLSAPQKILFLNEQLENEINNGGFSQYFANSTGDFAHETIASLKSIRADKTADLLQQAINEFPKHLVPSNRNARNILLHEISQKSEPVWSELDDQFYNYDDDLMALNLEYIKKNKEFFKF